LTMVPALLTLLGERTWYMPAWMNRVLPNITIEPPAERESTATAPPPVEVGAG
jgi:putative drug exporter of the RND superfamily